MRWTQVSKKLPEAGVEVIGFSEDWIDPDFNPDGTRACFVNDEGEWCSAMWDNEQDHWHTHAKWCCLDSRTKHFDPTHWQSKPKRPRDEKVRY